MQWKCPSPGRSARPFTPSDVGVEPLFVFQSALEKVFRGSVAVTSETCPSPEQSLHDLISMTLMKGSGLLDELDGLSCLLQEREE